MEEYIKLFQNHTQYEAYKNSADFIKPNVSLCVQENEVHYSPEEKNIKHYIAIDKLPSYCCDENDKPIPYDYDVSEEDYIVNHYLPIVRDPDYSDVYEYVGEYMYDSNKYYMWELVPGDNGITPSYILTTQKSFQGQTVRDNIQNRNCPVYVRLYYDLEIYKEHQDYIDSEKIIFDEWKIPNSAIEESVVTAKFNITDISNPTKLLTDDSYQLYFNKIEIDNIVQPNMINEYQFSTTGEHTIKYTLKNPKNFGFAFNQCDILKEIIIPNSINKIDRYAFESCHNLVSITIPNSVTNIREGAFSSCTSLTSLIIPDSVTIIEDGVFAVCRSLTSITIPNSVTSIGSYAFSGCSSLTSVTIPNSVTGIRPYAFQNCSSLTSVTIPNSVTTIGNRAFDYCSGLTSVKIPNSVTTIGSFAFSSCTGLTSITIPNSVTSIGGGAFYNCTGLTSITIPNSVTSIGRSAFSGCSGLTSVTIPSSVTSIGEEAFSGCSGLTTITIPESMASIGASAFSSCNSLTSIICNATTAPTIQSTTFKNIAANGTLTVPAGSTGYNTWMGTGNYYLGKYNWTKVEQQ